MLASLRSVTPTTEVSAIDASSTTQWWKLIVLAGNSNYYTPGNVHLLGIHETRFKLLNSEIYFCGTQLCFGKKKIFWKRRYWFGKCRGCIQLGGRVCGLAKRRDGMQLEGGVGWDVECGGEVRARGRSSCCIRPGLSCDSMGNPALLYAEFWTCFGWDPHHQTTDARVLVGTPRHHQTTDARVLVGAPTTKRAGI